MPLPQAAYLPGRGTRPPHGEAEIPYFPPERWRESLAYLQGVDLFNHGFYWEAHEAWEGLWRRCARETPQHRLLRGLIQLAAAEVKRALGERKPAEDLRRRASGHLAAVAAVSDPFMGLSIGALLERLAAEPDHAPALALAV